MAFIARVATFVTATFSLAGLVSLSTPGQAAEIVAPTMPMVQAVKSLTSAEVPVDSALRPLVSDATSHDVPVGDDDEFASLDAAVAAQDGDVLDEATRCLAGAIYFESKGEPLSGQLAVARVILNRAKSGRFPPDVCGVVTQRGQFGFVRGGRIPSVDAARQAYRTAVAVARVAISDAWDSAASEALYFNTAGHAPGARLQRVAAIGNHVFWR